MLLSNVEPGRGECGGDLRVVGWWLLCVYCVTCGAWLGRVAGVGQGSAKRCGRGVLGLFDASVVVVSVCVVAAGFLKQSWGSASLATQSAFWLTVLAPLYSAGKVDSRWRVGVSARAMLQQTYDGVMSAWDACGHWRLPTCACYSPASWDLRCRWWLRPC